MAERIRTQILFVAVFAFAVTAAARAQPTAVAAHPLETAISYTQAGNSAAQWDLSLKRVREAGAVYFRPTLFWWDVAPARLTRGFEAANPTDKRYNWAPYDDEFRRIVAHRLTPVVAVYGAPLWARTNAGLSASAPKLPQWRAFAEALARHYDGKTPGAPRIRRWQVWLEPNWTSKLAPQYSGGTLVGPDIYRNMVNVFARAVRAVDPGSEIIAGGTAPFRDLDPAVQQVNKAYGPLTFMRALLCVSPTGRPTCDTKVDFDVWAHHPYTSGGPTHHAVLPDDVSLGDLGKMKKVLDAAESAGHIGSNGPPRFWVTEFSWDSSPPDPQGVPMNILVRWTAEAMYRMWANGVSMVTWLTVRDDVLTKPLQSGLWFRARALIHDKPKPILEAFRFPVVAIRSHGKTLVWGRTPAGGAGQVVVERSHGSGWRTVATLDTNRFGIFQRSFKLGGTGSVRARLVGTGELSRPFGLRPVKDRFVNPFGTVCSELPCPVGGTPPNP